MSEERKIYYRCDCRACPEGCNTHADRPVCDVTSDPMHARNFELLPSGRLVEKPDGRNLHLDDRGPFVEV